MEAPLIRFCVRHGSSSTLHQILDASLNTRNLTLIVVEIVRILGINVCLKKVILFDADQLIQTDDKRR